MSSRAVLLGCLLTGAFGVLISLGVWQVQRLEWKTDVLAQIDAYAAADPERDMLRLDSESAPFMRGRIDGRWIEGGPFHVGPRTLDGQSGYHVYTPFQVPGGPVVFVNRGWVPADPRTASLAPPSGSWVGGTLMTPERPSMSPDNMPDKGLWYWPDVTAMAAEAGIEGNIFPLIIYQETGPERQDDVASAAGPAMFDGPPRPRNKHFQYAVFWFGMAGLLVMLTALALRRRP